MISSLRLVTLLTVAFLLVPASNSALAVEECQRYLAKVVSSMLGGDGYWTGRMPGYGTKVRISDYKDSRRILLLGDQASGSDGFSIGSYLAENLPPDREVVSTDRSFQGTVTEGRYTRMHLNHLKEFPFPDNSFDTIVMRRGLCVCRFGCACAGFQAEQLEARDFFEKVIRVLDKNNTESIAILHGQIGITPQIERLWRSFLSELERQYGVQVNFLYDAGPPRELNSIVIRPGFRR